MIDAVAIHNAILICYCSNSIVGAISNIATHAGLCPINLLAIVGAGMGIFLGCGLLGARTRAATAARAETAARAIATFGGDGSRITACALLCHVSLSAIRLTRKTGVIAPGSP